MPNVFDLRFINTVKYFEYFKFTAHAPPIALREYRNTYPHKIRAMDTADLIQFVNGLVRMLVRSRAEELFVSLMLVRLGISFSGKVAGY